MAQLLPTFKRHLHDWLLLSDVPDIVSLIVSRSHDIAYDPVFAIGDRVSHQVGALMLIFLTASIKFGL